MIIDTHSHIIAPDRAKYPLQPYGLDQGTGDDRRPASWFEDVPASAEQLLHEMDVAGVDGALLVQAMGAYTYDNAYVADSAVAYPDRFSSVVIVDMEAPDPADTLRSWAERGARGVRLFTITRPIGSWLDEPRSFPVWEAAAEARHARRDRDAADAPASAAQRLGALPRDRGRPRPLRLSQP